MYLDFYQLTERPFNVTPDPKFLYLNARYREALASLHYGITQRRGFITLIGEAGTGKTTLLKRLLDELDPKTKTVLIFNPNVTFEEILEYVLAEFDLPVHDGKKLYMLQRLNTFLLEELRGSGNVALLIDEAQDLGFSVLEDLRLLSNLETSKEKILQIVLSGQPELGQKLSNPALRQLRQRIGINCRLLPLSRDEISEYIQCRLEAAQCPDPKLFTREAEDQIFHFSRGIPRLVNVVCDNALVIGYAVGKKRIGADVISEAAADLMTFDPQADEAGAGPIPAAIASEPRAMRPWSGRGIAAGAGAAAVATAALAGFFLLGRATPERSEPPAPPARVEPLEVVRPGSEPGAARHPAPAVVASDDSKERERVEYAVGKDEPATAPRGEPAEGSSDGLDEEVGAAVPVAAEPPRGRGAAASAPERREVPAARELFVPPPVPTPRARAERKADTPPVAMADPEVEEEKDTAAARPKRQDAAPPAAAAAVGSLAGKSAVGAVPAPDTAPAAAKGTQPEAAAEAAAEPRRGADSLETGRPRSGAAADEPVEEPGAGPGHEAAPPPAPHVAAETAMETAPSAPAPGADREIGGVAFEEQTVRVGDSMSTIAERKYGQVNYTILDIMKLANPDLKDIDTIAVGQTLRLPELSEGVPVLNTGRGRYSLLVMSTPRADRARAVQSALRRRGLNATVMAGDVGAGKALNRVVVTGYRDPAQVVEIGKQVQRMFREDANLAALGE